MKPMSSSLESILRANKQGQGGGIASLCSAHPTVLDAAFELAASSGAPVLVESTCNQVNQFGGYTGMTPADFVRFIAAQAARRNFPGERLILGGDHLGPSVWQNEPAHSAMGKAIELVRLYVSAGYAKIHLDASMKLGDDDPQRPLDVEVSAERAAELAAAAETAWQARGAGPSPSYVIGTEVPIPGGAHEHENSVAVTALADVQRTIQVTRQAFYRRGLQDAWQRVIAVVVQPGVEFGDDFVLDYQPAQATHLAQFAENDPQLVFEAHSSDYQTRAALRRLVQDHFAILKVGPGLTFAYREAVFALAMIENELFSGDLLPERSNLIAAMESAMIADPSNWRKYYHGSPEDMRFARRYSFSDRIRYYWPAAEVQAALQRLFKNLDGKPLPLSLLSQYLPEQYAPIRQGDLANDVHAILRHRVQGVLGDYAYACAGNKS
jgi:D-tagatose-1,6-bisphosphate aldolase subunit GatZ/KbaZ